MDGAKMDVMRCMRSLPTEKLIAADFAFFNTDIVNATSGDWIWPTVDGYGMEMTPVDYVLNGQTSIPENGAILAGATPYEVNSPPFMCMAFLSGVGNCDNRPQTQKQFIDRTTKKYSDGGRAIRALYSTEPPMSPARAWGYLTADTACVCPTIQFLTYVSKYTNTNAYMYMMAWNPVHYDMAPHGADIVTFWGNTMADNTAMAGEGSTFSWFPANRKLSANLHKYIMQFALGGSLVQESIKPVPASKDMEPWEKFDWKKRKYMFIGGDLSLTSGLQMREDFRAAKCDYWARQTYNPVGVIEAWDTAWGTSRDPKSGSYWKSHWPVMGQPDHLKPISSDKGLEIFTDFTRLDKGPGWLADRWTPVGVATSSDGYPSGAIGTIAALVVVLVASWVYFYLQIQTYASKSFQNESDEVEIVTPDNVIGPNGCGPPVTFGGDDRRSEL